MTRPTIASVPLRSILSIAGITGVVVHVARPDLQIDAVTLGLLLFASLPWLAPIIKSVEVPGVGKVELQELQERVDALASETAETRGIAADAKGAAESADRKVAYAMESFGTQSGPIADAVHKRGEDGAMLTALAAEYDRIRTKYRAGAPRTAAQTAVWRSMVEVAEAGPDFDVAAALRSEDVGTRLAAYAVVFATRNTPMMEPVAETVVYREPVPFAQYWGIQTIARLLTVARDDEVPATLVDLLKRMRARVPPDSDRGFELRRILQSLEDDAD